MKEALTPHKLQLTLAPSVPCKTGKKTMLLPSFLPAMCFDTRLRSAGGGLCQLTGEKFMLQVLTIKALFVFFSNNSGANRLADSTDLIFYAA